MAARRAAEQRHGGWAWWCAYCWHPLPQLAAKASAPDALGLPLCTQQTICVPASSPCPPASNLFHPFRRPAVHIGATRRADGHSRIRRRGQRAAGSCDLWAHRGRTQQCAAAARRLQRQHLPAAGAGATGAAGQRRRAGQRLGHAHWRRQGAGQQTAAVLCRQSLQANSMHALPCNARLPIPASAPPCPMCQAKRSASSFSSIGSMMRTGLGGLGLRSKSSPAVRGRGGGAARRRAGRGGTALLVALASRLFLAPRNPHLIRCLSGRWRRREERATWWLHAQATGSVTWTGGMTGEAGQGREACGWCLRAPVCLHACPKLPQARSCT